jgi:hypothetical protein
MSGPFPGGVGKRRFILIGRTVSPFGSVRRAYFDVRG